MAGVGGLLLALGLVMLVLPGPGLLIIPLGIAVLAVEFRGARRGFSFSRRTARGWFQRFRKKSKEND